MSIEFRDKKTVAKLNALYHLKHYMNFFERKIIVEISMYYIFNYFPLV